MITNPMFGNFQTFHKIQIYGILRTGINNKEIPNNEELKNIIDKSLSNIDLFSGNSSYLEQINKINKICEKM